MPTDNPPTEAASPSTDVDAPVPSTTPVDPTVPPSGEGCAECTAAGGWWVHLRRCAQCGHVGCCDTSPEQHATRHFEQTGHRVMRSFEPGEDWWWDYVADDYTSGPDLAPPQSRPAHWPSPAPPENVPGNWRDLIHR